MRAGPGCSPPGGDAAARFVGRPAPRPGASHLPRHRSRLSDRTRRTHEPATQTSDLESPTAPGPPQDSQGIDRPAIGPGARARSGARVRDDAGALPREGAEARLPSRAATGRGGTGPVAIDAPGPGPG